MMQIWFTKVFVYEQQETVMTIVASKNDGVEGVGDILMKMFG